MLEGRKINNNTNDKYAGLSSHGEFVPIAVESHGPINRDALQFLSELVAGDWWRRRGMFEHLRFCFNEFPLWCNDLIMFCCIGWFY